MVHCGQGPTSKTGTISQPTPRTLKFEFGKGAIDSPRNYGWRVVTRACPENRPVIDTAPDQDGSKPVYGHHHLGG